MTDIGANAYLLSETRIARTFVENAPIRTPALGRIPIRGIDGGGFDIARASVQVQAPAVNDCGDVTDQGAQPTQANFALSEYETAANICSSAADRYSQPINQDVAQSWMAHRRLWYAVARGIATPAVAGSLAGLPDIISNSIAVNGVLTFSLMDRLLNLITDNDGLSIILMGHSRARNTLKNLCYAEGMMPPTVITDVYNPLKGRMTPQLMNHWGGAIWFDNDMIPIETDPQERSDIFAFIPGSSQGWGLGKGLELLVPSHKLHDPYVRREVTEFGSTRTQIQYTLPIGLSLGSQGAAAMLTAVNIDA